MALTPDETARLAQAEAAFEENGGRGVDLAEEIDALRRKRDGMSTCRHCERPIEMQDGRWVDPAAGFDVEDGDGMWRETCDSHDTFVADHEPAVIPMDDPRLAGMEAPLEGHGSCVVCLVGNGDIEHDPEDHQAVDVHAADGVPTSEFCPGIEACPDCQDVLGQREGEDKRASDLEVGDVWREDGAYEWVRVAVRNQHGDTVLLTNERGTETTLDIDTVVESIEV